MVDILKEMISELAFWEENKLSPVLLLLYPHDWFNVRCTGQ